VTRSPFGPTGAFRALRHRNFRLFLSGQIVSVTGTWMQRVALGWLVYRLTGSPFLLGVMGFAELIPNLVLAPIAGVWVDRLDRRRLVITTQVLAMVQALSLAALVLAGSTRIWPLVVLSVFLGVVNAFDVPSRQSFLVQMVGGRDDLANAIALNSSAFNTARLVGPSVAGALIPLLGEGGVFLLNGLSYVAVVTALVAIRVPPRPPAPAAPGTPWRDLTEGLSYVARFAPIRTLLLLVGLVGLAGLPYRTLMPVFARDILEGDARTLGLLMGAMGLGALTGALFLAARRGVRGLGRIIVIAVVLFGGALVAFSFSRHVVVSLALMAVAGFGMMVHTASSNTILQTVVDDDKRGRVMSFYAAALMGTAPVGSLIAGTLAHFIGAPLTLMAGGGVCVLGAVAFARALPALRAEIRPIYARLGIIPELAAGLQSAAEPSPAPRPMRQNGTTAAGASSDDEGEGAGSRPDGEGGVG